MTGEGRANEIKYNDLVFGEITYNPEDIGDFVIIRSNGSALYNFANVIDDNAADITHIIRGNSHLTNTPRQIMIYQALGLQIPKFGHLPDILNPDRVGKLSKRYGAAAVTELMDKGYLPQALINFLGTLGWSHPESKEFFDLNEMVRVFEFARVSKAPPAMDLDKLDFYNAHYLRELDTEDFVTYLKRALPDTEDEVFSKLAPLLIDRVSNFTDVHKYGDYFFTEPIKPEFKLAEYNNVLNLANTALENIGDWTKENIENSLRSAQQLSNIKPKDFFVTIGQAISGQEVFLPLFDSIEILGKEKTLHRLRSSLLLT
jgi:glutamyl-tRNA synthetase